MNYRKYLLIIVSFILINNLSAQNETTEKKESLNSLQLNYGIEHIMRQDLVFSPAVHKTISPINAAVLYSRSNKLEQRASISFSMYKPSLVDDFEYYWDTPTETETSAPHRHRKTRKSKEESRR